MEKELPNNWVEVQLIELLESLETGTRPKGGVQGILDGIPSVGGEHLNSDGGFKFDNIKYVPFKFAASMNRGKIKEQDILIVKDGATTGKTSYVDIYFPFDQAFVNEHVFLCRPSKLINSKCLYYFLRSKTGQDRVMSNFAGAAQGGINTKFSNNTLVSLPPLPEQQRIVSKLDTLFGHLDALKTRLDRIPQLLKDFRQKVLTQAVTGKLTEEWREGRELEEWNDFEQERLFLQKEAAIKKGQKSFKYKPAVCIDFEGSTKGIDELFELPDKWKWVSIDQVVWNISDGPHFSPNYVEAGKGIRFISGRNISYSGIDFSDAKFVSLEDHNEFIKRGAPEKGDILLTKGGTTGIACIVKEDTLFSYWVHVALLKPIRKIVFPQYLKEAFSSSLLYNQSQALTHGVGNQDLGLTRMIYMALPLPPFEEQQEIVRRVESLFAKADQIEASYQKLKAKIEQLPQALLAKTFRGELVEQLPTDGDARDLLEQIKRAKAGLEKGGKSKKLKVEEEVRMVAEEGTRYGR